MSTDAGVANALFVATAAGTISTTFSANPLAWTNGAFTGGAAGFCQLGTQIYSVFTTAPAGCNTVTLTTVDTSSCSSSNTNGNTGSNNTTINNISYSDNSYNVNGSIYNNSNNIVDSNNGNTDVTGNGNVVGTSSGNGTTLVSVNSILPQAVLAAFASGQINYYCSDDTYYYAQFCPTCPIVPVEKDDSGDCYYIDTSGATYSLPGYQVSNMQSAPPCPGQSSAQMGNCVYQSATCVSGCSSAPCSVCPQVTSTLTASCATVTTVVPCPTCPAGSSTSVYTTTPAPPPATVTTVVACPTCPAGSSTKVYTTTPAPAPPANSTPVSPAGGSSSPVPFTGAATTLQSTCTLFLSVLMGAFML